MQFEAQLDFNGVWKKVVNRPTRLSHRVFVSIRDANCKGEKVAEFLDAVAYLTPVIL